MSDLVGTPAQVAAALETSEDSVLWLKQERGLPHIYINRKSWVVPWVALDRWIDAEVARNGFHPEPAEAADPSSTP